MFARGKNPKRSDEQGRIIGYVVRLAACPDLEALRTVWLSIPNADRPHVLAMKDMLKARMEAET